MCLRDGVGRLCFGRMLGAGHGVGWAGGLIDHLRCADLGSRDVRPAAHLLSLLRPGSPAERKEPKKGDPAARDPLRGRPVFARARRGPRELASLKHTRPFFRLSRAKTGTGRREGRGIGASVSFFFLGYGCFSVVYTSEFDSYSCFMVRAAHPQNPLVAVPAFAGFGRKRAACCLRPKAEFTRTPPKTRKSRLPPEGGSRTQGRLSLLTFFGEAKKVSAPPGAHPGSPTPHTAGGDIAQQAPHRTVQHPTCPRHSGATP